MILRFLLILTFSGIIENGYGQLFVNNGIDLTLKSGVNLYIKGDFSNQLDAIIDNSGSIHVSGNMVNNSSDQMFSGTGLVKLNGTENQTISGSETITFYNLIVSNTFDEIVIDTSVFIENACIFHFGNFNVGDQTVTIAENATIAGESDIARFYGTTGSITTTRSINAPNTLNIGGLGIILTSTENLGATTVSRGFEQQHGMGYPGIERYYDITPTNNVNLNATVTFKYFDSELHSFQLDHEEELSLWKSNNSGATWERKYGVIDVSASESTLAGITSFSRWTLSLPPTVLPVELIEFDAVLNDDSQVDLDWLTASEENLSHFEIERRTQNSEFESIGYVNAMGNSIEMNSYYLLDESPEIGVNYYRLKSLDYDGSFEYSQIKSVLIEAKVFTKVFPTIIGSFQSTLTIHHNSPSPSLFLLHNSVGALILSVNLLPNSEVSLAIKDKCASGMYFYKVKSNFGIELSTGKILVE